MEPWPSCAQVVAVATPGREFRRWKSRGIPPETSNFYCLPGRAGGTPIRLELEKFLNAGLSKDAHRPEPERKVDCLVRVRIQSVWGYIGYPVFIAMHPSQFQDTESRDSLIWDPMRDAER